MSYFFEEWCSLRNLVRLSSPQECFSARCFRGTALQKVSGLGVRKRWYWSCWAEWPMEVLSMVSHYLVVWLDTQIKCTGVHVCRISVLAPSLLRCSVARGAKKILSHCCVQVGWGFGQPGLVEGDPAHGRGVGTGRSLRSLPTQTIWCSMILWKEAQTTLLE